MSKNLIIYVVVIFLNLFGTSYATGLTSLNESVSRSFSGSKYMSPSKPDQLDRYAATMSTRPSKKVVKKQTIPTAAVRRVDVQNKIKQLIIVSKKTSSDIRNEIKKIEKQKLKRIKKADIKGALDIANKIDRYVLLLQQKEKSLTNHDQDPDGILQTMTDSSQQLQLQLEEAMNKQQQVMQTLSNIMRNQHDTLSNVIRNMK